MLPCRNMSLTPDRRSAIVGERRRVRERRRHFLSGHSDCMHGDDKAKLVRTRLSPVRSAFNRCCNTCMAVLQCGARSID
jgi:hypothetical protein